MVPREFVGRFGRPTVRRYTVTPGNPADILPDDDRYLIVFLPASASGGYDVQPILDDGNAVSSFTVNTVDKPLLFNHAEHGAWVNIGWRLIQGVAAPSQDIYVVVGRMPPDEPEPLVRYAPKIVHDEDVRHLGRERNRNRAAGR